MRILVIDDAKLVHAVLGSALRLGGHDVVSAYSGEDGVARFRQEHDTIDGVVLDIWMPGMLGHEALPHLRAIDPTVPIVVFAFGVPIVVFAFGVTPETRAAIDALPREVRPDAWVEKPATSTEILAAMVRLR